tara:strand:+ start:2940 stop:3167 length:228 start_codon:yes stop_codon:yes gene_type:complete
MEKPNFRLYDLVICTETGNVGVICELRETTAVVQFPIGVLRVEYLDIEILERNASVYPSLDCERKSFRKSWYDLL